ncbi:bifunctional 3-(3-hydroxy-phenyl)propionate/3-hydroxycinnamic acid hydroxylase [Cupriavidus sp. 8B]
MELLGRGDPVFDVLIVGYGPAGATMANLLGKRGYSVAVFDQTLKIYDKPRAITADQEVMRVFQECGLAEEVSRKTTPHPGTDFIGMEGQLIKCFYPAPPPSPLAWESTWMFVQPELEATLRAGLARYPRVQEFLGYEFVECSQGKDGVIATIKQVAGDTLFTVSGKYLLGCDGGRSTVRRQMGAKIEDLAFDEWWIVVDAWMRGPIDLPPRCVQYCRPSRPGTYIVGPDNLRRWEIKMLPGETPDDFKSDEAVLQVLSTFVDTTHLEVCRTAIYRFHALVVDEWQDGRVFLMGDAAHQMPPFLGQGLCAGIRDALNLAWKIDGVERLGYSKALLNSYTEERKRHVRTIVGHAKSFGLIIGELDEAAARKRDRELAELLASGKAETVRQKFIPGLEVGLIGRDTDQHIQVGAGELFVQPWIHSGDEVRRLDDLLPPGFLVVAGSSDVPDWFDASTTDALEKIGGRTVIISTTPSFVRLPTLSLIERDGLFDQWLSSLGAKAAIIRPDHYVYGTAAGAGELRRLIAQLAEQIIPAAAQET